MCAGHLAGEDGGDHERMKFVQLLNPNRFPHVTTGALAGARGFCICRVGPADAARSPRISELLDSLRNLTLPHHAIIRRNPVNNFSFPCWPQPFRALATRFLLILLLISIPVARCADSVDDNLRAFARRVATNLRGDSANLEEENLSTLEEKRFSELVNIFDGELRSRGVQFGPKGQTCKIHFTISQNGNGLLAIAQVKRGESVETLLQALGRPRALENGAAVKGLVLQKEILVSRDEPILDVHFNHLDPDALEILGTMGIASYQKVGLRWVEGTTHRLQRNRPDARDLWGYVRQTTDDESAIFSTEICSLGAGGGDRCRAYAGRKEFSLLPGETTVGKDSPPWVSAAKIEASDRTVVFLAGQDGIFRVFAEDERGPVATYSGFGDQIAAFSSGCGQGEQILLSGKQDWTQPDQIHAMELDRNKLIEVAPPLQFTGPVVMLRGGMQDASLKVMNAVTVVRDLGTGRYEAYRISIGCGN